VRSSPPSRPSIKGCNQLNYQRLVASPHLDDQANHGRVNKAHQAELGILALKEHLDGLAGPFKVQPDKILDEMRVLV
jgi:hypothetical protein